MFLREEKDRGCGKLLADGADRVLHLRSGFHGRRKPGQTVGLEIGDAAILDDRNRSAGHLGRGQYLVNGGVDAAFASSGRVGSARSAGQMVSDTRVKMSTDFNMLALIVRGARMSGVFAIWKMRLNYSSALEDPS
jgi:hypothetical protein